MLDFIRRFVESYKTRRAITQGLAELRKEYEAQGLVVSPVRGADPSYQLAVALGWLTKPEKDVRHSAACVQTYAEQVAARLNLTSFGSGSVAATGGEYVVYVGLRKDLESRANF